MFTGEMTWYDVGQGSCGLTSSPGEHVVAMSTAQMGVFPNPNLNPSAVLLSLFVMGTHVLRRILFEAVAPTSDGRVVVDWWFSAGVGGGEDGVERRNAVGGDVVVGSGDQEEKVSASKASSIVPTALPIAAFATEKRAGNHATITTKISPVVESAASEMLSMVALEDIASLAEMEAQPTTATLVSYTTIPSAKTVGGTVSLAVNMASISMTVVAHQASTASAATTINPSPSLTTTSKPEITPTNATGPTAKNETSSSHDHATAPEHHPITTPISTSEPECTPPALTKSTKPKDTDLFFTLPTATNMPKPDTEIFPSEARIEGVTKVLCGLLVVLPIVVFFA
ncbi:hypothetical protein LTR62_003321 [Meristemomyces frigidus]|uniref:Uncharacterized protein n=1 Tax=Meristemomyces frigidus TaxID=1508187 RepID=A0AAN7TK64_9PEZI|nr:hypothetical protein LTR62_003321 [Meristemomyces frigidus]